MLLLSLSLPTVAHAGPSVEVCHGSDADPNSGRTLLLPGPGAAAHVGHGDYAGPCHRDAIQRIADRIVASSPAEEPDVSIPMADRDSARAGFARVYQVRLELAELADDRLYASISAELQAVVVLCDAALAELELHRDASSADLAADAIDELQRLVDSGFDSADADRISKEIADSYLELLTIAIAEAGAAGVDALVIGQMSADLVRATGLVSAGSFGGGTRGGGDGLDRHPGPSFDIGLFEQNIRDSMIGWTGGSGYAYSIGMGGALVSAGHLVGGKARKAGNAPEFDLTEHTPMNIASITKPITAAAVMQLIEADPDVDLDDSIAPFLPCSLGRLPGRA